MYADEKWKKLGWRHPLWNLIRFYLSIKGSKKIERWEKELRHTGTIRITEDQAIPIPKESVDLLFEYKEVRDSMFNLAFNLLRDEEEAKSFCKNLNFTVGQTTTKSQDHHQASKAMIAAVSNISKNICTEHNLSIDDDPQRRCVWCKDNELHVTARNLDGAIPGLINPYVIWEIKEYWGKTKGGSKMSDAVYECQLVGHELIDYSERTEQKIYHVVFLDGKTQWSHRKSDLKRFIDLLNQGLIDHLIIGKEVESIWESLLDSIIKHN